MKTEDDAENRLESSSVSEGLAKMKLKDEEVPIQKSQRVTISMVTDEHQ